MKVTQKKITLNPNSELSSTRESTGPISLYTKEEISNISALGDILRQVRARLIREGISIEEARKKLLDKTNML